VAELVEVASMHAGYRHKGITPPDRVLSFFHCGLADLRCCGAKEEELHGMSFEHVPSPEPLSSPRSVAACCCNGRRLHHNLQQVRRKLLSTVGLRQ
jgi:hypothetical protein